MNNSDNTTNITVSAPFAGWPASTPFAAAINIGAADEEVVSVTTVTGSTATIVRGVGTGGKKEHAANSKLTHCSYSADFAEANAHINASANVHGLSGGSLVVGTTSAQTLSNKTLITPTIASFANATHNHTSATSGGTLPSPTGIPIASVTGLQAALDGKEDVGSGGGSTTDPNAVHVTGNETVGGNKTFTGLTTMSGGANISALNVSGAATIGGTATMNEALRGTRRLYGRDDLIVGNANGVTTNSSGIYTVNFTNPSGRTVVATMVQPWELNAAHYMKIFSPGTNTSFNVAAFDGSGNLLVNTSIAFMWVAICG